MKKIIAIVSCMFFLGFISTNAQEDSKVEKAGSAVKKGAKKVGNKTAEVASKSKATVTDQRHKDKVGPNGQTIYIDNHSRYYWVDKKGHRHYVRKIDLKNKQS